MKRTTPPRPSQMRPINILLYFFILSIGWKYFKKERETLFFNLYL
jgi:hypothetical protein